MYAAYINGRQTPTAVEPIGFALVLSKVLDIYDLNWAIREAKLRGKPLEDVLVDLELVSPMQIQHAYENLKRVGKIE